MFPVFLLTCQPPVDFYFSSCLPCLLLAPSCQGVDKDSVSFLSMMLFPPVRELVGSHFILSSGLRHPLLMLF